MIKQKQAKSISKRGKALGRKYYDFFHDDSMLMADIGHDRV